MFLATVVTQEELIAQDLSSANIVAEQLVINGSTTYDLTEEGYPTSLNIGDQIEFIGVLVDVNGIPLPERLIGIEDGVVLANAQVTTNSEGRFTYSTNVSLDKTFGPRLLLFFPLDSYIYTLVNFFIDVPESDNIYSNEYLQGQVDEINKNYTVDIANLTVTGDDGQLYWANDLSEITYDYSIDSAEDVNLDNYQHVIRQSHIITQTDPWFTKPEILERALQIDYEERLQASEEMMTQLGQSVGPARILIYGGGMLACFNPHITGPLAVASCTMIAEMAVEDAIKAAGIIFLSSAGADGQTIDEFEEAATYTFLAIKANTGSFHGVGAHAFEVGLEKALLALAEQIPLDIINAAYEASLGIGDPDPFQNVSFVQLGDNFEFNFDFEGDTYTVMIEAPRKLETDFSATPTSGEAPLTVQFSDLSNSPIGNIVSWEWDFDDDSIIDSQTQNPMHTYTESGVFDVSLTVSDGISETSITKESLVFVDESQPEGSLELFATTTVEVGDTEWLTVYSDPIQQGVPITFNVGDPSIGTLTPIGDGVTNFSGYANAEFRALKTGSTSIIASSPNFTSDTKTVTVVETSTSDLVTMIPRYISGNESSSVYEIQLHYNGFSWNNEPFTLTTSNGTWNNSGTNVEEDTFGSQDDHTEWITITEAIPTTLTLSFAEGSFSFSFVPAIVSNVTMAPFKTYAGNAIFGVAWSVDGAELVYTIDEDIKKINTATWEETSSTYVDTRGEIEVMKLSNDGQKIVYGDGSQLYVRTYSDMSGLVASPDLDLGSKYHLGWTNDDSKIVVARADTEHKVLSSASLSILGNIAIPDYIYDISLRPGINHYAIATETPNEIHVYNSNGTEWNELHALDINDSDEGSGVTYSPDGNWLAGAEQNSVIQLFNAAAGYTKGQAITDEWDRAYRLQWNSGAFPERNVLAASVDRHVYVYDMNTYSRLIRSDVLDDEPLVMEWSPNGEMLALITDNGNFLHVFAPFDQIPPSIVINNPDESSFRTTESTFTVSGFVSDYASIGSARLQVDNNDWVDLDLDADGGFSQVIDLIEGDNQITIEASDPYLNTATETRLITKTAEYTISGTVTNNVGAAVPGIIVSLSGDDNQGTQTDENGGFSFNVASEGTYTLTPSDAAYTFAPEVVNHDLITENQIADFTATRITYEISGTITDEDGLPIEGASLTLSGDESLTIQTDATGGFRFPELDKGVSFTITPNLTIFSFSPQNWSTTDLDKNWMVDFTGATSNISFNTTASWNMVGLPLNVLDANYKALFPNALENTLYKYDNGYIIPSSQELQAGVGYWLKFPSEESISIEGAALSSFSVSLRQGWNMIAGPNCSMNIAEVSDPNNAIQDALLFEYDEMYIQKDPGILEPGKAYWLYTSSGGNLTFSCSTESQMLSKRVNQIGAQKQSNDSLITSSNYLEDFGRLTVIDGTGRQRTMYFGASLPEEISRNQFLLPPLPNKEVFDVRFSDHYSLSETENSSLRLQAAEEPIQLVIDQLPPLTDRIFELHVLTLDGKVNTSWKLEPGATIELDRIKDHGFLLASNEAEVTKIPVDLVLEQNYPNPFSKETIIRYGLPEATGVKLQVFDILGREVTTLVDLDNHPVGYHEVTFIPNGLASGVYFYTLETRTGKLTSSFTITK